MSYQGAWSREQELDVLTAALSGNEEARSDLFRRYNSLVEMSVRKVLSRSHRPPTDADIEDMTSDIWVSLFAEDMKCLRRFEPERNIRLSTWIGLLSRNKTIDRLRTNHDDVTHNLEDDPTIEWRCTKPHAHDELELRERTRVAQEALGDLKETDRQFLEAWYLDDVEPEELATQFNIAVGTVYSRRFKLQEKLSRSVEKLTRQRPITTRRYS